MSNLRYRPEIDGLRALAVIGVVLYHIGLGFPGGYVGVDVFFVISGYLITGIIVKDLHNGTFSMLDFWVRRIRRILPAVTVVVLACLIAGYFTMDEVQYRALGRSATAQSLMVGNIYFYRNASDYFASNTDILPLLHTWSLAVEEQFYVFFPLLLFAFSKFKKKHIQLSTMILGVGSLLLSIWAMNSMAEANFSQLKP